MIERWRVCRDQVSICPVTLQPARFARNLTCPLLLLPYTPFIFIYHWQGGSSFIFSPLWCWLSICYKNGNNRTDRRREIGIVCRLGTNTTNQPAGPALPATACCQSHHSQTSCLHFHQTFWKFKLKMNSEGTSLLASCFCWPVWPEWSTMEPARGPGPVRPCGLQLS